MRNPNITPIEWYLIGIFSLTMVGLLWDLTFGIGRPIRCKVTLYHHEYRLGYPTGVVPVRIRTRETTTRTYWGAKRVADRWKREMNPDHHSVSISAVK